MPKAAYTNKFNRTFKKFAKNDPSGKEHIKSIIAQFAQNPQHPSLHLEKLSGSDVWTIRIDKGNRLFFLWSDDGDTAIFFLVGPHDSYRKLKN